MFATVIFFVAIAVTFLAGFPVHRLLVRANILDRPNERSSHVRPTVRGGGIAIMGVVLLGALGLAMAFPQSELWVLLGGAVILAILSWIDDIRSLPSAVRFAAHAAVALAFIAAMGFPAMGVDFGGGFGLVLPVVLSVGIGFLWLAGYTNAFNFMDGINGISGFQVGITGIATGLLAAFALGEWNHPVIVLLFLTAGAAFGFLPHNFPRARMFMGDVSSAPLGFILAAMTLWTAAEVGWWLLIPLALLHANYVFDTGITLVRRVLRGESWHSAHREHFYQRLVRSGKSHTYATLWEAALQVVVAGLMVVYFYSGVPVRLALIGVVVIIWFGFFAHCERRFRVAHHGESWVKNAGAEGGYEKTLKR